MRDRWRDDFDRTGDPVGGRTFSMVDQLQDPDDWTGEIHRATISLAALGDAGGSAGLTGTTWSTRSRLG